MKVNLVAVSCFVFLVAFPSALPACTRVVYVGPDGMVVTGRTMDFSVEIPANLWVFPRGMERNGEVGPNSIRWTSRYGSVSVSSWDFSVSDGMNEKGLMANLLWLVQTEYPKFEKFGNQKGLSAAAWAQYALDNFATVKEAVQSLQREDFVVVSDYLPNTKKFATVHLSLSDASGDSAIFEYIKGRLVIHHHPSFQVMTNDPPYEQQLAINSYWQSIPGTVFLPGTNRSSDRFVRAAFYIRAIPRTSDPRLAVAGVFSVIRNVSVPFGISIENQPHLSSTRWRVVADQKNLVYYYESVVTPNVFWVDLKKIDFSAGTPVLKLPCDQDQIYAGEANQHFVPAQPFQFLGL